MVFGDLGVTLTIHCARSKAWIQSEIHFHTKYLPTSDKMSTLQSKDHIAPNIPDFDSPNYWIWNNLTGGWTNRRCRQICLFKLINN